jgi:hypothetical protein
VPIIDEALPERLIRRILRGQQSLVCVFHPSSTVLMKDCSGRPTRQTRA